jgi:hypothetical protein
MTEIKKHMVVELTVDEVYSLVLHTKLFTAHRRCEHAYDFGDEATVGKCLKRGEKFGGFVDGDFGRYLGYHASYGFCVLTLAVLGKVVGGEAFASLDGLKAVWMLD